MFRSTALFTTALISAAAGPVFAAGVSVLGSQQTDRASASQIEPLAVPQIGSRASPLALGNETPRDRLVTGSPSRAAAPLSPQVTAERGRAYVGAPVPAGRRSAEAPASLTRLEEGRDTSAVVPTGDDRCDPARGPLPAVCDKVIEARADEFQAPDNQPLSAEQRLLASQRELRPSSLDIGSATRRLASGELDESDAALGIASVALQGSGAQPAEPKDEAAEPSFLDALVAGITTFVTGAAPTP